MVKKVIDLNAAPSLSRSKSSETKTDPKVKASTSSKKTQLKNKKCAQRSKLPKTKTSLLQQGLDRLKPLIPRQPLQSEPFAWNKPPQFVIYAANFFSQQSVPSLYNFRNNLTFPASYYSNYSMMMKNMRPPPQTPLTLFPGANVNNSSSALKEGFVKKTADSGSVAVASNGKVDLELRLWFIE